MSNVKLIKSVSKIGCTFLGKGIKGHPEMGVVSEAKSVIFAEKDVFGDWVDGTEQEFVLVRTDNGFCFDSDMLDRLFVIENYAPNYRSKNDISVW